MLEVSGARADDAETTTSPCPAPHQVVLGQKCGPVHRQCDVCARGAVGDHAGSEKGSGAEPHFLHFFAEIEVLDSLNHRNILSVNAVSTEALNTGQHYAGL